MLEYQYAIWVSFALSTCGIMGLFFSTKVKGLVYFASVMMAGIILNLLIASFHMKDPGGKMIALFMMATFAFEIFFELYFLKRKKIKKLSWFFYALPFLSFFLMATARDLLAIFVALEGFQICLNAFALYRPQKAPIQISLFKEGLVSLCAFGYGLSLLYMTRGLINLAALRTSLEALKPLDPIIVMALGFIALGIIIKANGFIRLSRKTHA